MSSNSTIYVGFWINRADGPIVGSTLTLSNSNGAILIAALAIFCQLAGGQSWSIICFIAHQMRVSKKVKSGLHHQQQAILRNNNSDVKTLWQLTTVWWSWRANALRPFHNSVGLILISLLHLAIFGATSILSSHITVVGSQVLMAANPHCGPWRQDMALLAAEDPDSVAFDNYMAQSITAAELYVQSCIKEQESLPECDRFQRLRLNWTAKAAACPFQDLCLGPTNSALLLDTGFLDSRDDLGINGDDADRVQFRRIATCSPVTTKGYTKSGTTSLDYRVFNKNSTFGHTTINYTAAFYGPNVIDPKLAGIGDSSLENNTYLFSNFREVATVYYNRVASPYDMDAEIGDLDWGISPIPQLSIPNSTLTMVFLQFYGTYTAPSDDLWLSAHQPVTLRASAQHGQLQTITEFGPDEDLSVLACTEQYQFCDPSKQNSPAGCTAPASLAELKTITNNSDSDYFSEIFSKENQLATARELGLLATSAYIWPVANINPSPLLAKALTLDQVSLPPAPNQWILETENWFEIGLATLQRLAVNYITGPPLQHQHNAVYNQTNRGPGMDWLCRNQIVKRKDFTNFSTLAIGLVFGLGASVIILSFYLETLLGQIRRRWPEGRWKQTVWWSEGTLQLQRRAFEGMGITDWKTKEWDVVPVTRKGVVWRGLEIRDETLPLVEKRQTNITGSVKTSDQESSQDMSRAQTHVQEDTHVQEGAQAGEQEGNEDQISTRTQVIVQEDAPENLPEEQLDPGNRPPENTPVQQGHPPEPHYEPKGAQKCDEPAHQPKSESELPVSDAETSKPTNITRTSTHQVIPETTSISGEHDADHKLQEIHVQALAQANELEDQKNATNNVSLDKQPSSTAEDNAGENPEKRLENRREADQTYETASPGEGSQHQQIIETGKGVPEQHHHVGLKTEEAPEEKALGQDKNPEPGESEKAGSSELEEAGEKKKVESDKM